MHTHSAVHRTCSWPSSASSRYLCSLDSAIPRPHPSTPLTLISRPGRLSRFPQGHGKMGGQMPEGPEPVTGAAKLGQEF